MDSPLTPLLRNIKHWLQAAYLEQNGVGYGSIPGFSGNWPRFVNEGNISLGNDCVFRHFRLKTVFTTAKTGSIKLGNHIRINDGTNFFSQLSIEIGDYTMIGDQVTIYDTSCHDVSPDNLHVEKPVRIGRNVWIGSYAIILPGVSIGDHAVVGAGAVVTKDIPSKCIAVGNSANVVRSFDCPDNWVRE
jgi:acetyltransferase-like isoleucine patch superfamily enzyme